MIVFVSPFCSYEQIRNFFMSPVLSNVAQVRHEGHLLMVQLETLLGDAEPPILRTISGYLGCTHILDNSGLLPLPQETGFWNEPDPGPSPPAPMVA